MEKILSKYAIPQLFTTVITPVPTTATANIVISTKLQTQIGLIYGISLTVGGVDGLNNPLISYAQSALFYLSLKKGSSLVLDTIRLDKFVYNNPSATVLPSCDSRYFKTMIPGNISLDQSFYANPSLITAGEIMLDLWYIDLEMTSYLIQKGAIDMSPVSRAEIGLKY